MESAKDVSVFCESLMKEFSVEEPDLSDSKVIDLDYACERESEQLRTLILEDDPNDVNVNRFIDYIEEQGRLFKEKGKWYLFKKPTRVSSKKAFDSALKTFDYHVIVCDIEIREEGKLNSLGFNIASEALKLKTKPLYYVVTNVTRSLYEQIKMPGIRHIRLKSEVFGNNDSICTFLYGIKEIYEQRKADEVVSQPYCEQVFDRIYSFLRSDNSSFSYNFKTNDQLYNTTITSFDELENVVKIWACYLIKKFLGNYTSWEKLMKERDKFYNFDDSCKDTRNYIKSIMSPNDKFVREFYTKVILDRNDPYKDPTNYHLQKFTIRLILRRFFFYVREFIKNKNIYDFDDEREDKMIFTISDFACRAVSYDFKELEGEDHSRKGKKTQTQGRSLEKILLISSDRNPEYLTPEEENFLECLKKKKDEAFPLDENKISELNFSY